ncbi:MAG: rod shape-determining protein MreC [Gemmatimonadaceae bacterium]
MSGRLDTIVFAGCAILAVVASALPTQMRDPVASGLRRTIVAPLVGLQTSAERWRAAWQESERRTLQADSIALRLAQGNALIVENERLRRLLGLGSRLAWGFIPAEALHMAGRAEDVMTTLTLTAGSKAGVTQYSPVVAPEGIVGLVQTVDPNMSIAILFSHPDFRVCAMTADGSAFGIVYPHLDVRPGRLAERYLLELRNVAFGDTLRAGTAVFSCGLGGAWPRGVLIGMVIDEVKESESWSRTYILRPSVNPAQVSNVMIMTADRRTQGVGNIWADEAEAVARATAVRRIVTAGDSVTREQAMADAAARRPDSTRRASVGDSLRQVVDSVADSLRQAPRQAPRPTVPPAPVPVPPPVARDTIVRDTIVPDTIRPDTLARRLP